MTADYAIVLAGHGSRDPDGVREFEHLVALMRERVGQHRLDYGYLEFARPTLAEAVQASIAAGSRRIVVVPALLFAATHAKNDMPGELHMLQQAFPDVALHFGAALDLHPLLLRLAQQRIVEAEAQATRYSRRADTCLVVVGRGTSDQMPIRKSPSCAECSKRAWVLAHPLCATQAPPSLSSPTACAPPRAWVSNALSCCRFCSSMAFS